MPTTPDDSSALHLVLERLSSLFRARMRDAANDHGLKLVQLEALVYLSVANRYSDTAVALGEYLGVTKGTVSQTLRALERRGLLQKVDDPDDARVLHCRLTDEGSRVAAAAHPASFLQELPAAGRREALSAAIALLRALQAGRGFRSFGQCQTCHHFGGETGAFRCGLTGEGLTQLDSTKICREHEALPAPEDVAAVRRAAPDQPR